MEVMQRHEAAEYAVVSASRELRFSSPERSALHARFERGRRKPAAGANRERATERVQAEQRIRSGKDIEALDGVERNQIPIDDIAERLVDANAIEEHRQALR